MAEITLEALARQLVELESRWEARAAQMAAQAQGLRAIEPVRAEYTRGLADGLVAALGDLRALLEAPLGPEPASAPIYADVSRDTALTVLGLAGLRYSELHAHSDRTFTITFAALQTRSLDEAAGRLAEVADVTLLGQGRLPQGGKLYLDFAFLTPPSA